MNKRQREAAEKAMLKHMLDTNPKMKAIIDNMIENPPESVQDVVAPTIEATLKKARMEGVMIGWQGFALQSVEKMKDCQSVEEVKQMFENEANKIKEQMNLKEQNSNE